MSKCQAKGDLHLILALVWAIFVLQAAVVLVGDAVVVVILVMTTILHSTNTCQVRHRIAGVDVCG